MPTYRWAARSTTPSDWRWTAAAIANFVVAGDGTYPDPAYVHADAGDYGPTGTEYTPELSALVNWTIIVPPSAIDAGRVQQICEALIYLLATADAAGAFARTLGTDRAYTTDLTLEAPVGTLSVLAVPAFTHRRRTSNGTWRRDVVVEILVRTHLDADAEVDQATTDAGMYLIEQIDDYLAHPDHQTLTLPDGVLAIYVEPTDMRAEADIRSDAGAMWMREHLTHLRQVTGLVRVAYYLDVSY